MTSLVGLSGEQSGSRLVSSLVGLSGEQSGRAVVW